VCECEMGREKDKDEGHRESVRWRERETKRG
jgi:hypothetical protein